jgi:hypothetical protein
VLPGSAASVYKAVIHGQEGPGLLQGLLLLLLRLLS